MFQQVNDPEEYEIGALFRKLGHFFGSLRDK
jgi:hypothetical protein